MVSLSTGVFADVTANCDNAVPIGQKAASEMTGKKFTNVRLRRNDKVKTIGSKDKMV